MTEYAIPPIMLTPTQSTHGFQRRSSIRRGTIASISKDVRVKDFVEIIKKQKALHQQERNTETDSILLKRRHSMMNINKSFIKQQQQPVKGDRILSNNDLKGGTVWQQQQQQQQTKQQQQTDTDKIRLGGNGRRDEEDQTVLYQHLRKCAACLNQNNIECFSSEQEEEEENSPSPSTSSSSNEPWHQGSLHHVEQREQIIKNLNSSMTSYSAKVKELNRCYNGEEEEEEEEEEKEYKLKIEQCKKLVAQQELLLNQLYYNHVDIVPKTAPTPPPLEKNTSTFKSIYHDLYKGFKSTTTGITIKQKEDKNEADTIISVQGVCTTIEPSLIPDNLIVSRSPADPSSVYQHNYSLDINHLDRQTKFKLLLQDQWQKDDKVNQCSFHQCNTPFNWFQRKHHCRACGEIYCNTHSGNRLPLFSAKETHHPVFSRVCDTCFYSLAKDSLY